MMTDVTFHASEANMMESIRIEQVTAGKLKNVIDEFYARNGSKGTARNDDLFFIAFLNDQVVGCVRFCVEEGTPLLRTMYIDESMRQKGVGKRLLLEFGKYLDLNNIENVYCLPYVHLESFYGTIGFKIADSATVPQFLIDRSNEYLKNNTRTLFMKRE